MEIAVVGATAVVTLTGGAVTDARVAITALAPTIRRVAERGDRADRQRRRPRRGAGAGAGDRAGVDADLRRARLGRIPVAMAAVIGRRAIEAADPPRSRGAGPDPRQPRTPWRAQMKAEATLTINGTTVPVELDPHASLLRAVRDAVGLTGAKEGCDDSECGACMMLLDGEPVNSCSYLALQARGSRDHDDRGARRSR